MSRLNVKRIFKVARANEKGQVCPTETMLNVLFYL